jgi:hypothetical protein
MFEFLMVAEALEATKKNPDFHPTVWTQIFFIFEIKNADKTF